MSLTCLLLSFFPVSFLSSDMYCFRISPKEFIALQNIVYSIAVGVILVGVCQYEVFLCFVCSAAVLPAAGLYSLNVTGE